MGGEAGTRLETGTRKFSYFFAIIPAWQVSSFWFLDSSLASYQRLGRGSWQEWGEVETSGSASRWQPPSNFTIWVPRIGHLFFKDFFATLFLGTKLLPMSPSGWWEIVIWKSRKKTKGKGFAKKNWLYSRLDRCHSERAAKTVPKKQASDAGLYILSTVGQIEI